MIIHFKPRNTMRTIRPYAERILKENYDVARKDFEEQNPEHTYHPFEEWVDLEKDSDPDFYRFLFNDGNIDDFGANLTAEESNTVTKFIESL